MAEREGETERTDRRSRVRARQGYGRSPPALGLDLTVGSRPMWCTAMDTFCTMWKRSPATVMVLPPLRVQRALSTPPQPCRASPA